MTSHDVPLCVHRYNERTNLEVQLFNIQMKLHAARQKNWYPSEGKLVSDISRSWVNLEAAEHERAVALRKELMRCNTNTLN